MSHSVYFKSDIKKGALQSEELENPHHSQRDFEVEGELEISVKTTSQAKKSREQQLCTGNDAVAAIISLEISDGRSKVHQAISRENWWFGRPSGYQNFAIAMPTKTLKI